MRTIVQLETETGYFKEASLRNNIVNIKLICHFIKHSKNHDLMNRHIRYSHNDERSVDHQLMSKFTRVLDFEGDS